jgi:hypothetical protein
VNHRVHTLDMEKNEQFTGSNKKSI